MISFELAKKLRESGFIYSTKKIELFYTPGGNIIDDTRGGVPNFSWIPIPTLSELIVALKEPRKNINAGHNFLIFTENENTWNAGIQWFKDGYLDKRDESLEGAVANLWLDLNKK